jgi:hypothetical protein
LVKGDCTFKHTSHINHFANIPIANILVKDACITEHI